MGNPFKGKFAFKEGTQFLMKAVAGAEHGVQYINIELAVTENIPLLLAAVNMMIHEVGEFALE